MQYPLIPLPTDLRASRQSLVDDGRRSRASALQRSMRQKSIRQSTRSRSRDRLAGKGFRDTRSRDGDRGSSGYRSRDGDGDSLPDSDHWATSTDNNWTDYDQEVNKLGLKTLHHLISRRSTQCGARRRTTRATVGTERMSTCESENTAAVKKRQIKSLNLAEEKLVAEP